MYLQDIHQVFNGSYTEYMTSGTTIISQIQHKYVQVFATDTIKVFILYQRHEFNTKTNTKLFQGLCGALEGHEMVQIHQYVTAIQRIYRCTVCPLGNIDIKGVVDITEVQGSWNIRNIQQPDTFLCNNLCLFELMKWGQQSLQWRPTCPFLQQLSRKYYDIINIHACFIAIQVNQLIIVIPSVCDS
ncbi:hypothetical protein FGO68_gene2320 [Halteria grandinella]|uniref:Uncharacterized protein n=1 Tax=Halteria grandinella TaxID=5974 RepID=A0A8J8N9D8_HALGN|nr:hypothetical protein FGO68_gene2320 [Halteria grandinella]